jgi:hypothetical protein
VQKTPRKEDAQEGSRTSEPRKLELTMETEPDSVVESMRKLMLKHPGKVEGGRWTMERAGGLKIHPSRQKGMADTMA